MSQIDVLRANSVFLVHGITQNGGAGNVFVQGKTLYERFEICYRDKPELSCSTILKGDTIQYLRRNNFFGPCGLIIIPGIISFATHQDSGTHVEEYGLRSTEFGLTTIASEFEVENAIKKRNVNSYNELTVKDYSIFGIFLNIDDSAFLYHNIIDEATFHNNTAHYNLDYYFIQKGLLHRAVFEEETGFYKGTGNIDIDSIYINVK